MCTVTKFVIGYKIKQTQIQRFLPKSFHSCTGVLRLTIEIIENAPWLDGQSCIRIELNTPVSHDDIRGWYNFVTWENRWITPSEKRDTPSNTASKAQISCMKSQDNYIFTVWTDNGTSPFLTINIEKSGVIAGIPSEDDNDGTFYYSRTDNNEICYFKPREEVNVEREKCSSSFSWDYSQLDNIPRKYKNLPMVCEMVCDRILGSYTISFQREIDENTQFDTIIER